VRAEALRALEQLGDTHLLDAAVAAIADPDAEVRMEGQRLLAKLNPEASVTALESALERGALREKQGALGTLAGLALPKATAILSRWLDRLLAGQVEPEVQLDLIEAARARSDASLEEKIARYEATKPADDPLAATARRSREAMRRKAGSFSTARRQFRASAAIGARRKEARSDPT
jgi:HEAT repeat protein